VVEVLRAVGTVGDGVAERIREKGKKKREKEK
jgi:hypothetical protein